MAKNAVYEPYHNFNFNLNQHIKQAALLFDKVFVTKRQIAPSANDFIQYRPPEAFLDLIRQNEAIYEYLIEQGVIAPFKVRLSSDIESFTCIEQQLLFHSVSCITQGHKELSKIKNAKDQSERDRGLKRFHDMMNMGTDSLSRYCSACLAKIHAEEFYPILRSTESFDREGAKTKVVRLLLNHIPLPTKNTPWEAIIDFRKDESTRLKYLALMNWINELANSPLTANELNEKLEYLYLDYKRSFERHRLKATTGVLEIFTAATIGFFTSNVPAALNLASNIVRVGTTVLNLQEEEGKLPGKEIAYIYHANKTFCDGRSPRSA